VANLKLGKCPDRTAAKITITVGADFNLALGVYATLCGATHGEIESVAKLTPVMLDACPRQRSRIRKGVQGGLAGEKHRQAGPPRLFTPCGQCPSGDARCLIRIAIPGMTRRSRPRT